MVIAAMHGHQASYETARMSSVCRQLQMGGTNARKIDDVDVSQHLISSMILATLTALAQSDCCLLGLASRCLPAAEKLDTAFVCLA